MDPATEVLGKNPMENRDNTDNKEKLFEYVWTHYWFIFRANTSIVSSTCRQLALGIGGVLLIQQNKISISSKFIITLLVFFFLADLFQYTYQSFSFRKLAKDSDDVIDKDKITNSTELRIPPEISYITNFLFSMKIVILLLAALFFLIVIWTSCS